MTITYWTGFSKRKNSTLQPSSAGTQITAVLKENTSTESPTFILASNDFTINYVQAFGNYYFVSDRRSTANNLMELDCEMDLLATYKTEIGATSAFVTYTTNGNSTLIDPRLPKDAAINYVDTSVAFPWTVSTTGSYRVSLNGINGCYTYSFPWAGLGAFLQNLTSWSDNIFNQYTPPSVQGNEIEQIKESLQWMGSVICGFFKQLVGSGSVKDNIKSCIWVPFDPEGAAVNTIYLGQYDTGYSAAQVISTPIVTQSVTLQIPWSNSVTGWRRAANYDMYIYLPFVGVIQVQPSSFIGLSNFTIDISRDRGTGSIAYEVKAGTIPIGTYGAETGANYPIGVQSANLSGATNSVIAIGAGIAAGGAAGAAAIGSGVIGASNSLVPTASTIGGISGAPGAGLDSTIRAWSIIHDTSETPGASASIWGIPLMAHATINTLSGYVQTENASVSCDATGAEKDLINNYLNTGFYYE